ncbi:DUF1499 domain-containing protein [Methyloversatilis discipulorum]|uniref:DUF1499 domain-containing protein n=1 Tax=Methyloversatilis discipulorum TaxID=1119528 RepID=UPI000379B910|nr:DUF1499 domain-containing protein [Methyloversatilis discipulorum]
MKIAVVPLLALLSSVALAAPPAPTPCPDKPNCVSTEASDKAQMAPIPFSGTVAEAQDALRRAITAQPRSTITRDEPGFVAAEFRSRVFGFVDAAEFVIDADARVIRFRSGARSGHYDFGVNRERMDALRAALSPAR